jgi:hypothetical protein
MDTEINCPELACSGLGVTSIVCPEILAMRSCSSTIPFALSRVDVLNTACRQPSRAAFVREVVAVNARAISSIPIKIIKSTGSTNANSTRAAPWRCRTVRLILVSMMFCSLLGMYLTSEFALLIGGVRTRQSRHATFSHHFSDGF